MSEIKFSKGFTASIASLATLVTMFWGGFTWLNTNYASAADFQSFKKDTKANIQYQGMSNEAKHLTNQLDALEDKIFELQIKKNNKLATATELAVLNRYLDRQHNIRSNIKELHKDLRTLDTENGGSLANKRSQNF